MLTTKEIKRFIEEDTTSEKKSMAMVGQRYYEADHDIRDYRMFYFNTDGILVEDKARSNIKISHPFFTELVDQLATYMLSFEDNPIQAKETAEGLQEHLDVYFDEEFWAEIQELIIGTNAKGFEYLYAYKNHEDRLAFHCADSLGVVEVRAKDTDDGCEYIIYWYIDRIDKGKKRIKRIEVHSKDQIWFYVQVNDGKIVLDENEPINPLPNIMWTDKKTGKQFGDSLGFIPFWRLDNNRKQISGLKPVKDLIDDYDLMQCGLSNNIQDFDTPLYAVKGFQGDDLGELQQNLKVKKIIGVGEDGGIEAKTIDIPYQARKTKADEDKEGIYHFGMGFDPTKVGDGNVTNVVIRSRYTLLDMKAGKLQTRLKRFLKGIIQVVLDEINAKNKTDYTYSDIKIDFAPVIPTNEAENIQNAKVEAETERTRLGSIMDVAAYIGDEQALKAICNVMDWDFDELKDQLEKLNEPQNTINAKKELEGVVVDDEVDPEDPEQIIDGGGSLVN